MDNELMIAGIGISGDVLGTIVKTSVEKVAGVASVGERDLVSGIREGIVSLFTQRPSVSPRPVSCRNSDDGLEIDVHLAAFFGYQFSKLAADVRSAVARAVSAQIGVKTAAVNVYIDDLVFPKE